MEQCIINQIIISNQKEKPLFLTSKLQSILENKKVLFLTNNQKNNCKILQTISYIVKKYQLNSHMELILIIAPASIIYNWKNEFKKFAPQFKKIIVDGTKQIRKEILKNYKNYQILITSYPLLRRDFIEYESLSFSHCFIDEAQHIKNPTSLNAKVTKGINSTIKFALTGTPIENNLTELWSIFDFVLPGLLLSHHKFQKQYEIPITRKQDKVLLVKVRQDKRIINKSVYIALGVDLEGKKDVLGLWISENEGAKFWLTNLTKMKNRGLNDILIACSDNLTGMSEAIQSVYPKTEHQLCIVHQIRNSLKYVSYKHRKSLVADLKPIYTACSEEQAMQALESFESKWNKQYSQIAKAWYKNWENLMVFISYPAEIKRVIYTTNSIESVNNQLRKVIRNKKVFPNDMAVFKIFYLAIENITKKWTMPIQNWNTAIAHFMIKFEDKINLN